MKLKSTSKGMLFKCAFGECDRKSGEVPPFGLLVSFDRGDPEGRSGFLAKGESMMKADEEGPCGDINHENIS